MIKSKNNMEQINFQELVNVVTTLVSAANKETFPLGFESSFLIDTTIDTDSFCFIITLTDKTKICKKPFEAYLNTTSKRFYEGGLDRAKRYFVAEFQSIINKSEENL